MKLNESTAPRVFRACLYAALSVFAISFPSALSLKNITAPATLVYSPDSIVETTASIRVAHDAYLGPFSVVLTQISLVPASDPSAETLSFGLYKPDTSPTYRLSLNGFPANETEVLSGAFDSANSKKPFMSLGFAVIVSPSSLPPPGNYVATIRADLYASAFPVSGGAVDTDTFTVTVSVPALTDLSIVPGGGGFSSSMTTADVSFGTITAGASRGVDIRVRSNVHYSVSLVSANGGMLVNALDGGGISYTLAADGVPVSLPKGLASIVSLNAPPTWSNPSVSAISVTINPFSEFPVEGTYSDLITVNVTAP